MTGHHSSQDLFTSTATVFVLEEKKWIEKGSGMVKFIYDLTTFELRLVVHSTDSANRRPFICRLKPKIRSKGPRAYVVRAFVSNDLEEGEQIVAIRFDREHDSSEFRHFVEERDGHNSNGFGVNPHPPFFPPEASQNYQDTAHHSSNRKSSSSKGGRGGTGGQHSNAVNNWCCAMCTLLNEPNAAVCAVCGAKNPEKTGVPAITGPTPTTTTTGNSNGDRGTPSGSYYHHSNSHHAHGESNAHARTTGHHSHSRHHNSSQRMSSNLSRQRESIGAAPPSRHQRLSISYQHQRNASQSISGYDVVVLPMSEENLRKHDRICPPKKT